MFRVENDAERNILLATDEDKFRRKYREITDDITVTFASPHLSVLEMYKYFLLSQSEKRVLDQKYYYRPDYVSQKEYGTETLWYLILFVNDISCIEEFNKYEIYVPSYSSILQIAKKDVSSDVTEIKIPDTISPKLLELYASKISPVIEESEEEEEIVADEEALYWVRQKFEIKSGQESNGYLDLAYIPIEDTVTFKAEHGGNFIYGVDYYIIESFDGQVRRLSWLDSDCPEGPGLLGSVVEDMMVEILYAKSSENS